MSLTWMPMPVYSPALLGLLNFGVFLGDLPLCLCPPKQYQD